MVYSNQRGFTKYSEMLGSTTAVVGTGDVVMTLMVVLAVIENSGSGWKERERLDGVTRVRVSVRETIGTLE